MVMYRRYSLFMPYGKSFRTGLAVGWVKNCAERFVQPRHAGDGFQRPLRSRFQPRLMPGVRLLCKEESRRKTGSRRQLCGMVPPGASSHSP